MKQTVLRFRSLPPPGSRVALAMSGGVDSSLCARLLVEHGCSIVGVTMKVGAGLPLSQTPGGSCFSGGEEADAAACKRLCDELGAPWELVDLSAVYEREVLEYFRREYLAGRTPNPCLRCNPILKFGLLPAALAERGHSVDWYATGHYVRILEEARADSFGPGPLVYLATAKDRAKDQSYFLQRLDRAILSRLVFPLGDLHKSQVRTLARERGLESAEKPDSQDFASREDLPLIFADRGGKSGDFVRVLPDGRRELLGRHRGLEYYTVGQRRGLGLAVDSTPLYVLGLDAERNEVVVGGEGELFARGLCAGDAVWQAGFPPTPSSAYPGESSKKTEGPACPVPGDESFRAPGGEAFRALAKIRLATPPFPALVRSRGEGSVEVAFSSPLRAITAGQSVAFYLPLEAAGEGLWQLSKVAAMNFVDGKNGGVEPSAAEPLALVGGAVIERALEGASGGRS